jgi:DNA polymerase/3'-5' exonuclease PolX
MLRMLSKSTNHSQSPGFLGCLWRNGVREVCPGPDRARPGPPVSLSSALELADHYRQQLATACARIELAGELRRGRFRRGGTENRRLEYVLIPKVAPVELGRAVPKGCGRDLVAAAVREWVMAEEFSARGLAAFSRQKGCYRLLNEECEVVLWVAARQNFGSLWLWRTGSRRHLEWLCERARRRQLGWAPQAGLCSGLRCCGAEEDDIYGLLGLRYVPPAFREPGCYEGGQYDQPEESEP